MRRVLPESVLQEVGKLDPTAIAQVCQEAWPDVRDADELADVLHTLIALPAQPEMAHGAPGQAVPHDSSSAWANYFESLRAHSRATRATVDGKIFWVAAERSQTFSALYPNAQYEDALPAVEKTQPSFSDALLPALNAWMTHIGPPPPAHPPTLLNLPPPQHHKPLPP